MDTPSQASVPFFGEVGQPPHAKVLGHLGGTWYRIGQMNGGRVVSSLVPKFGLLQISRQNSHPKNQFGEDCPAYSHLVSLTLTLVFSMVPGPWPQASAGDKQLPGGISGGRLKFLWWPVARVNVLWSFLKPWPVEKRKHVWSLGHHGDGHKLISAPPSLSWTCGGDCRGGPSSRAPGLGPS